MDVEAARDAVLARGMTINGLPILTEEPWLLTYYEQSVIGGPGAFAVAARNLASFGDALRRKLVQEIKVSSAG